MPNAVRLLDRAAWVAQRQAREAGDEFHERRLALGLSQEAVSRAGRLSRNRYGSIENGRVTTVTLAELNRIAAVLGLSTSLRHYPSGVPVRDAGHTRRLQRVLGEVRPPLSSRAEVPLPIVEGRGEQRAWDAVIFLGRHRCALELEMRLRDVQAMLRRVDLKRRDDPTEAFVLLVADTRANRRVLAEFEVLFRDLPRLRPSRVMAALREGRPPPTGLMLV